MIGRKSVPHIVLFLGIAILVQSQIPGCTISLPIELPWLQKKHPDAIMIFVEESSERDLDFAVLMQNKKWTDSLKDREITYRVFDKDQPEAKTYIEHCQQYPSVLFVTPEGKLVRSQEAPKTGKEADALIAEVMGK